ncbi:hypothetical protein [Burkholderia sp. ABCPW 14]|uniref:hypothetical protein n=1 Tax=Burkholderia sp. ABCPW 14 TaxID=1637860 RepID=UPI000A59E654|nr:hypothetical protein [Burkholderia sp. ABCPW 14]
MSQPNAEPTEPIADDILNDIYKEYQIALTPTVCMLTASLLEKHKSEDARVGDYIRRCHERLVPPLTRLPNAG